MKGKSGNAKAWLGVFHKGAIMKWIWVLIAVLLVPVSAHAERSEMAPEVSIFSKKYVRPEHPHKIIFSLKAREDGDFLRAKFRFFFSKFHPVDSALPGECVLLVNNQAVSGFGDYWIAGKNGPELWLPSLTQKDRVEFGVFWDEGRPVLEYATLETENNRIKVLDTWHSGSSEWLFAKNPLTDPDTYYQELSLEEVCSPYTLEEQLKEAKEKQQS